MSLPAKEEELDDLGLTKQLDRTCLMKQTRLLNEKENFPSIRKSATIGNHQSTPLNPKSKCHLSPALLSRISFNDHSTLDEMINKNKTSSFEHLIETPQRVLSIDKKTSIPSSQKKTSPTSTPGMRTMKTLSDTISLQKKILLGTDRLKRLTLTKALFKRQTTSITKKLTNLTNKLINPFSKVQHQKMSSTQIIFDNSTKSIQEIEERRKLQVLNLNNESRYSADLNAKQTIQMVQTFGNRRFKLGAPTTFLTRSLANYGHTD